MSREYTTTQNRNGSITVGTLHRISGILHLLRCTYYGYTTRQAENHFLEFVVKKGI